MEYGDSGDASSEDSDKEVVSIHLLIMSNWEWMLQKKICLEKEKMVEERRRKREERKEKEDNARKEEEEMMKKV